MCKQPITAEHFAIADWNKADGTNAMERLRAHHEFVGIFRRVALRISRTVFSALPGMRLLACLIVAPQRGYDEPAILSYAISSFCLLCICKLSK